MTARKKKRKTAATSTTDEQKNTPHQKRQKQQETRVEKSPGVRQQKKLPKKTGKPETPPARPTGGRRKKDEQFDPLHQVAFWGLALLLFFPPYFRGLFFAPEQEKALMFATLVFWLAFLWRWLQNDHKFLRGPLDWFALALPVVYIISSFTAVNKGLAIDEVVKNILYFMTYWSVSRLVRNEEDVHKLLHVIYASAIGVALAGLATATEIIYIKDGFRVDNLLGGRIYSTFQYPNALASYLAALLLIGMYLWYRSKDFTVGTRLATGQSNITSSLPGWFTSFNPWGYLYACGNFLLLAVLLGTKSRGGLLVFGLVFLIYLAGLGARGRLAVTLHIALNAAVAYICVTKFIHLAVEKQYNLAWVWILAGLVAVLIIQLAYKLMDQYVFTPWAGSANKFNLVFGSLFALGALGGGIWLFTQKAILQKISGFKFLQNAIERMYFVEDAVEMFKEKPLLGWGGGGWEEAYRSFQNYLYNSNEVHSYYFQLGVETGLLGLLAVAGIWLSFICVILNILRNNRENQARWQLVLVFGAAFLVIGGHAMIDFNLSLSALTLVLWTVFGIASGISRFDATVKEETITNPKRYKHASLNSAPLVAGSVGAVIILVGSLILVQANSYAMQAGKYLKSGQLDNGLAYMEKAATYNPFNAGYHVILSQIYRAKGDKDKSLVEAQRAVQLSPYDASRRINLAEAFRVSGKLELAVEQAEKAVEQAPYLQQWYNELAQIYMVVGYVMLEQGKKTTAKQYLQKTADFPDRVQAVMDSLDDKYKKMWRDGPPLTATDAILLATGAARYQLGQYDSAEKKLLEAAKSRNKEIKGKSLVWLALVADKQGQGNRVEDLLNQAESQLPNAKKMYSHVKGLPVL